MKKKNVFFYVAAFAILGLAGANLALAIGSHADKGGNQPKLILTQSCDAEARCVNRCMAQLNRCENEGGGSYCDSQYGRCKDNCANLC